MSIKDIACPVCDHSDCRPFLHRPSVVVHQHLVVDSAEQARKLPRGELRLACCQGCGFVFNAAFDPALVSYGSAYDNSQTSSPHFLAYTEDLVRHLVDDRGARGCRIVEVGCGNGGFLRRLLEHGGPRTEGWGFDPSYVGPENDCGGRAHFIRSYYDEQCTGIAADVVVCRHVIEHVPQPVALLRTIRKALTASPEARLFFETPCVEWILRHQVVWDFFYEHCSYFSPGSLRTAFERAGFGVLDVRHVFGGQYLWIEAAMSGPPSEPQPGQVPELAAAFGSAEAKMVADWRRRTAALEERGPLAIWGAGAKGVTFANLLGPDARRFACVVDLNPRKQGRFLPGTGHPIVAPSGLDAHRVTQALVMNPNYRAEIEALLARCHGGVEVIDLQASNARSGLPVEPQ